MKLALFAASDQRKSRTKLVNIAWKGAGAGQRNGCKNSKTYYLA